MDLIERTPDNGSPLVGFPLYDAHGNDVATLTRSGSSYSVADRRSYDAWGAVRAQQSGGDPTLRYCGSLGHRQDDESGMVYMRARYYEPTSGRFVSEDPGMDGINWFSYCENDPIGYVDHSGKMRVGEQAVVTEQGEVIDNKDGSVAFNVKRIAQEQLKRLFEGQLRQRASDAIHALKSSWDMGSTDDFLYDFAKQTLFTVARLDQSGSMSLFCLGTIKQLCEDFLEGGGF